MYRKITLLFAIAAILLNVKATAQISIGGEPLSYNEDLRLYDDGVETVEMPALDMNQIEQEDAIREAEGKIPFFARLIPVNLNTQNSGTWYELPNGDRVWKLRIKSEGALALTLYYDNFHLPKGGRMYIYNGERTEHIGGFTPYNNPETGLFATQIVRGDVSIIEYYEPRKVAGQGVISISDVGHAYRMIYPPVAEAGRGSDPCQVDVNCSPEGDDWQDEKQGAVGIQTVSGGGAGWCSGSVVNNTSLDCTPYVLTALHCGVSSSSNDFNQYVFYFNYESTGCGSGSVTTNNSVSGCQKIADSGDGGGNSGSDFLLVELNSTIPQNYNAYYNGWNAQTSPSSSGVSIHHPSGDRKKISTYTQSLTTTGWGISGTHWQVYWAGTTNGHGVTEGGSSGSPLFDSNGRIVGTLTGGGSFCSQVPNPSPDAYGKMSYHWTSNPGDDLKTYLDPGNTGALVLSGTYYPCSPQNDYDAGITAIMNPDGNLCQTTFDPVVTLKNFGSVTLTSVEIIYNVDGSGNQTYNWTGSLTTNNSVNVTLPSVNVSTGAHTFNAWTEDPNGQPDADNSNDASSSGFNSSNADDYVVLRLTTDDYGNETTWELSDDQGNTLYSGGPYQDNSYYEEVMCLSNGECYNFTIYDSENDGICCDYGVGNYSLGNSAAISIVSGAGFGASESTNFCLEAPDDCDTIVNSNFANGTPIIYAAPNSGYVTGTNGFDDMAKAQEFPVVSPIEVEDVLIWIAIKSDVANDPNAAITVNIHDLDGNGTNSGGATSNAPGTVLGTTTVPLSRVDTAGFLTMAEFTSPISLTNDYAVSVNFTTLGTDDEVAIVSSSDGDANQTELAWEQWSDGNWHTIYSAWSNTIDGDIDLGIFPIECEMINVGQEEFFRTVNIYPNPTNDAFTVDMELHASSDVNMKLYNSLGALVEDRQEQDVLRRKVQFDLSGQGSGIYFLQISSGDKTISRKVILK